MKQILVVTDRHGLALHHDLLLRLQDQLSEEYEVITVDRESQQLQTYLTDFNQPIMLWDEKQMGPAPDAEPCSDNLLRKMAKQIIESLSVNAFPAGPIETARPPKIRQNDKWPGQSYKSRSRKHRR